MESKEKWNSDAPGRLRRWLRLWSNQDRDSSVTRPLSLAQLPTSLCRLAPSFWLTAGLCTAWVRTIPEINIAQNSWGGNSLTQQRSNARWRPSSLAMGQTHVLTRPSSLNPHEWGEGAFGQFSKELPGRQLYRKLLQKKDLHDKWILDFLFMPKGTIKKI